MDCRGYSGFHVRHQELEPTRPAPFDAGSGGAEHVAIALGQSP